MKHLTYTYQARHVCTGAAVGAPVAVTDPACDAACDTSAGPGVYLTTRLFHPDTCAFDAPTCVKLGPCPLEGCP